MAHTNTEDMPAMSDYNLADFVNSTSDDQPIFFDDPLDFSNYTSFESVNQHSASEQSTPQTISPRDLMQDNISAPASSTLTDLTTPGTNTFDSPWVATSTDPSPSFGEEDIDEDPNHWAPLFEPLDQQPQSVAMSHSLSTDSATSQTSRLNASPATTYASPAPRMSRNHSSPGQNGTKSGQHGSTFGVGARRRDKPLPAITVDDPNDSAAVKRARNTMAARKSRQKRMERQEDLEGQVEYWKRIAISLGHVE